MITIRERIAVISVELSSFEPIPAFGILVVVATGVAFVFEIVVGVTEVFVLVVLFVLLLFVLLLVCEVTMTVVSAVDEAVYPLAVPLAVTIFVVVANNVIIQLYFQTSVVSSLESVSVSPERRVLIPHLLSLTVILLIATVPVFVTL